jgi:hypothetical protein
MTSIETLSIAFLSPVENADALRRHLRRCRARSARWCAAMSLIECPSSVSPAPFELVAEVDGDAVHGEQEDEQHDDRGDVFSTKPRLTSSDQVKIWTGERSRDWSGRSAERR